MKAKSDLPVTGIVSVDTEKLSLTDSLKLRMMQLKSDMPEVYMPVYEDHYGKQTDDMKYRIRECVNLRITDEAITENWEKIVRKRKNRDAELASVSALAKDINETAAKNKSKK